MSEKPVFQTLNEVNIENYTKEKNKLKYLPWSSAWEIVKLHYPNATFRTIRDENNRIYHTDGKTCWVETEITIEGLTQSETLAVMNFKNQSITYDDITSVDFGKSIKRCLTKNAALFGLGLSLWNGEELSNAAKAKKTEQAKEAEITLKKAKAEVVSVAKKMIESGIDSKIIYSEIEKIAGKKNPNSIKDIEKCNLVLEGLKKMSEDYKAKKLSNKKEATAEAKTVKNAKEENNDKQ